MEVILVVAFVCFLNTLNAQVAVFSEINQMDDLRVKQVTGKDSISNASFNLRSSSAFYQWTDPNRKFWQNDLQPLQSL